MIAFQLDSIGFNNFDIILCTSGMLVYTKEISNQELIYAVTKSVLNTSYNVYIAFCPQCGNKKLNKLDDSNFKMANID